MNSLPGVVQLDGVTNNFKIGGRSLDILIATRVINSKNIFTNGLYQNILFLYRLFRCLGHHSILLLNEKPNRENADILLNEGYEVLTPEGVLSTCDSVDLYIEIGMSIHVGFIHKLREMGARIVKLYLGNALNIDTEMIVSMGEDISFPHHTYSEIDEMWTSPHYIGHLDYLCGLYRVPVGRGKIAPYIWDSSILERVTRDLTWGEGGGVGAGEGGRETDWKTMDIIITEPNISYQKCALVPLILAEEFARTFPEWRGKIIVMNSVRLLANVHLQAGVLSDLDIMKMSGRVIFKGRESIDVMMRENPGAVFISHQLNNEFNYMTLELMWKGWPVLHNSAAWREFGYYWSDTRLEDAVSLLLNVMKTHSACEEKYRGDARLLAWSYSMYNPSVQGKWQELLLGA